MSEIYDRDTAREMLENELAGSQYQRELTGPVREFIDAVLEWLGSSALTLGSVSLQWGPILVAVLVLGAVLLVVLLVRPRLQRGRTAEHEVTIETGFSADDLRERAANLASAGRYDDAARDSFRALVRSAEQKDELSSQRGRTASEIAVALTRVHPQQADQLQHAAELFNQSVYARRPLRETHFRWLRDLDRQLAETHGAVEHRPVQHGDRR